MTGFNLELQYELKKIRNSRPHEVVQQFEAWENSFCTLLRKYFQAVVLCFLLYFPVIKSYFQRILRTGFFQSRTVNFGAIYFTTLPFRL